MSDPQLKDIGISITCWKSKGNEDPEMDRETHSLLVPGFKCKRERIKEYEAISLKNICISNVTLNNLWKCKRKWCLKE